MAKIKLFLKKSPLHGVLKPQISQIFCRRGHKAIVNRKSKIVNDKVSMRRRLLLMRADQNILYIP